MNGAPAHLPLAGVRVVDLTSNIAAPFAGAVLADLGADVVHVESRGGDDSRRMAPRVGDTSAYWQVVNRNKQILRLDIREEGDRHVLDDLVADADVFLTNLRPGKLARNGLDAPTLRVRHPRLIHAALSAYGDHGEERDRAGYDAVLQARTGIAEVTGTADGPPVRAGVSVLDVGSGTWLALGVIAALLRREHTGEGGSIATSLFETGANWVAYHVAAHQISGTPSSRHGSGHPAFAPYGIFATADGQVCLGIGGDDLFRRLCVALDVPHLADDPAYARNVDRVANNDALRARLESILAALDAHDVVTRLDAHGVACDVVQRPEDLLSDPQTEATGVLVTTEVDGFGPLAFPGLPLTFDGVRPAVRTLNG
jgi:crotonobetainyl-CoA:carnitine CoA-transferase CaiB-like acyl-CoA transferase